MATDIDFKNIWQQQSSDRPNREELLGRLKKFRNENLRRLVLTNIALIATSLGIGFIWFRYQPQMISTKIGIILVILAMVIFLLAYNRMFMLFYTTDTAQSNSEFLQNLYMVKNKQKLMQTTMLNIYFIMLILGIFLYMYEYASMMKISSAVLAYGAVLVWMVINWFYIRPKTVKKQQEKLNGLIRKFEELNNQFKEL